MQRELAPPAIAGEVYNILWAVGPMLFALTIKLVQVTVGTCVP